MLRVYSMSEQKALKSPIQGVPQLRTEAVCKDRVTKAKDPDQRLAS